MVALGERDSRRAVAVLLFDDHDTHRIAVNGGVKVLSYVVKLSFEELTDISTESKESDMAQLLPAALRHENPTGGTGVRVERRSRLCWLRSRSR